KWSNNATTKDLSGLAAGTYSVVVTDANSCTATASVTITEPTPVTANYSTIDVTCYNGSDGKVNVSASGGTSPYKYLWSTGATTQEISGLSAGTYFVVVTDANGCKITKENIVVGQPSQLSVNATSNSPVCEGGSINLDANGGNSYSWTGPAGFTSVTKNPSILNASTTHVGIYTVTVSDSKGCSATATTEVKVTDIPDFVDIIDEICVGKDLVLIAPNYGAGYAYKWTGPQGATSNTRTLTVPNAQQTDGGTYIVTVTFQNCSFEGFADITVLPNPEPPLIKIDGPKVICTTGSVKLIAEECTGTVKWSTGASGFTLVVSEPGTYYATCTVGECESPSSNPITIEKGSVPDKPTITTDKTICCDGEKATLTASACNGNLKWSTGATTQSITVGVSGSYTVTCSNNCGTSSASEPIEIQVGETPTTPVITVENPEICTGEFATLKATNCNGTVYWSNGEIGNTIQVSAAGKYTAYCKTICGVSDNSNEVEVKFGNPPNPPVVTCQNENLCPGQSAKLTAEGCDGTVTWSNGQTGVSITVTTAGIYTATCTNNCGTSAKSNELIITTDEVPDAPTISSNKTEVCGDEKATLTATGCDDVITWSNGLNGTTIYVEAGTYTATCSNACGTSVKSNTVTIGQGNPPSAPTISSNKTVCCDGEKATLTAQGCTGTVKWSTGESGSSIQVSTSGTYTAT
ncbi:MAG: hypothetical protein NXI30_28995, partial [bacterium]|nr:hypothetical protein [bacterium]